MLLVEIRRDEIELIPKGDTSMAASNCLTGLSSQNDESELKIPLEKMQKLYNQLTYLGLNDILIIYFFI